MNILFQIMSSAWGVRYSVEETGHQHFYISKRTEGPDLFEPMGVQVHRRGYA